MKGCKWPRKLHAWHALGGGIWDGKTCAWCGTTVNEVKEQNRIKRLEKRRKAHRESLEGDK